MAIKLDSNERFTQIVYRKNNKRVHAHEIHYLVYFGYKYIAKRFLVYSFAVVQFRIRCENVFDEEIGRSFHEKKNKKYGG